MTSRRASLLSWALLSVLLTACASTPPASPDAQYYRAIKAANTVYEETLLAAGRAHTAHLITDAQLEKIRSAGIIAEGALGVAKAALQSWVAYHSDGSKLALVVALTDLERAGLDLLNAWHTAQHGTGTGPDSETPR